MSTQTYTTCDVVHDLEDSQFAGYIKSTTAIPIPTAPLSALNATEKKVPGLPDRVPADNIPLRGQIAFDDDNSTKGADGKFYWNEKKTYPWNCIGKLTTSGGYSSASVIGPNLILTCGHCVHPGATGNVGDTYKNIVFSPGYPVLDQHYQIIKAFIHREWINSGKFFYDLALCVTKVDMNIPDRFGIQTMMQSKPGWWPFGYPAEPPFDGGRAIGDNGPETNEPWNAGELKFEVKAVDGIDLTKGSSGGPWIARDNFAEGNILLPGKDTVRNRPYPINGVNSHQFDSFPGVMVSPSFTGIAEAFFRQTIPAALGETAALQLFKGEA